MANISNLELNGTTYNIKASGSIPLSEKGAANGVASLDSTGKVPSSQLPSSGGGSVNSVKVGSTSYNPDSSGVVSLPAYPTSLPANGGTASNVSGTVAIANGGTGATSASSARSNLGLGSAATKSSTTSVTSGSSALVTSGAVYSAINEITPNTTYNVAHNVTTSNTYELVNNLYVDVPSGKRVFITAGAKRSNPIGIAICDGNTYAANKVVMQNEVTAAQAMISVSGIYDNGDNNVTKRLYVFMKSQTSMSIQSRITLSWWYI